MATVWWKVASHTYDGHLLGSTAPERSKENRCGDPPQCTLFYYKEGDDIYQQFSKMDGLNWSIITKDIYVGKEGVAAAVESAPEQQQWFP